MTGNQGKLQSSNAIPSASSSSQSTTEQSQVDKHQVLDTSTSVNDAQSLVQGVAVLLPLSKALPMTSKAGEGTPSPSLMQSDQQINAVASNSSPSSSTPTLVSVGHVSNLALVSPSHLQNADEDQARTITRTRKKRTIEDFVDTSLHHMQQVSQAYSLLEDLVRPIDPDLTALQSSMLAVESPDDNTARKDGASKVAAGKMSRVVVLLRAIVMVEDLTTENNELKAALASKEDELVNLRLQLTQKDQSTITVQQDNPSRSLLPLQYGHPTHVTVPTSLPSFVSTSPRSTSLSQAPNVLSHASQLTQLHLDTSSNLDDTIAAKVVMPKKMIWPAVPLSPDSALKDCSMNTEEGVTLKQCANTTANDVLMDDTNPTFKPDLSLATSWTAPSYHSSTTPFANAPSLKTPSSIPPLSFTAIQEQKTHDLTMARTASTTSSAMVATPSAGSEASGSVYTPSLSGDSSSGQVSPQMFVPNTTAAGSALDSSRKNKNDSDIHEHSKIKGIPRGQSATSQSALVSTAQEDTLSQSRTLPVQVQPNQEQTKKPRKKASSRNSLALAPIPSPGLNCRLSVLNTPRRGSGSLTLPSSNDGNGTNASVAQHNVIHLPTMPSLQNLRIHTSTIRGRRQSRKNSTANGNSTSITPAIATGGNAALDKATIGVNALGLALPCGSAISSTVSSIDKTVAAAQSDELHQRPANEVSNLENGGRRRSSNVIGTMDFEPSTSAFTSLLPTPTPTSINFQAQDSADDSALAIPSTSELHTVQLNVRSPVSREEDPFLLPSGAVASSDVIKNNMKLLNHVEGRQRRGTYLTDFPSEHGRNMLDMMYDPGAPLHFEHQMQMWMAPYHQQFLNHQLHQQQMSAGYPQYGYTLFPPAYGGHTVPYLPGYPYSNANNQSLSVDLHTPNPYNSTYISNATASTLPYYTPLSSTSGQKRKNDMMEHVDTLPQYVTNFVDQQVNIQSGGNVPRSTFGFGYVNQPNQWSTNKKNFISELQQDHSTQQTSPSTFIGNTLHTVDTTAKRARLE